MVVLFLLLVVVDSLMADWRATSLIVALCSRSEILPLRLEGPPFDTCFVLDMMGVECDDFMLIGDELM